MAVLLSVSFCTRAARGVWARDLNLMAPTELSTLYWLTNTAISSARLYWDTARISTGGGFFDVRGVRIPVGVSAFPDEIYAAPRSWAERAYPKLMYYNRPAKGGHFAAWEQPQEFTEELRASFKSLRELNSGAQGHDAGVFPKARAALAYSCSTTLRRELLISRPPLYSMSPSFLNLFMKKLTRERVVPIISASVSCDILGITLWGLSSLP